MPSEGVILTIAIPTYNRCGNLAELFSYLAPQLADEPDVELIVIDNASQDDTPSIIRSSCEKGLSCWYIRNEQNIGADANILKCFREAHGKYVWIIGDDDILLPGALDRVLDVIRKNECDLIYVDFFSFRGEMKVSSSVFIEAEVIEDKNEFVKRANHSLSFISGSIVNRELVVANIECPLDDLIGSSLVQMGWMYTALNHFRRGVHVKGALVAARDSDSVHCEPVTVFGANFVAITNRWLHDRRLRKIIFASILKTLMPFYLIRAKRILRADASSRLDTKSLVAAFRFSPLFWAYNYPIVRLPLAMAEAYLVLVRACNKINRMLKRF